MSAAKITGLTHSNVDALRQASDLPAVTDGTGFGLTLGRTVAEFGGCGLTEAETASMAIRWLDDVMRQMPTKGHPRASLHAVRRKLANLVPAHEHLKGQA